MSPRSRQHLPAPASDRVLRSQSHGPPPPPSPRELFQLFKKEIAKAANGLCSFQVDRVPAETGHLVARSLSEDGEVERIFPRITYNPIAQRLSFIMPTAHHNSVAVWAVQEQAIAMRTGFFTLAEHEDLEFHVGTRVDDFPAPWPDAFKEPDGAFYANGALKPSVILETANSESWPKVGEDKDLWIQGGAQFMNAILLVKWNKRAHNTVAGYLEIHRQGGQQSPRVQIFPVPPPGSPQGVTWYRRDFYPGGVVPQGRNGNDRWEWDIDRFRKYARRGMARESLVPA